MYKFLLTVLYVIGFLIHDDFKLCAQRIEAAAPLTSTYSGYKIDYRDARKAGFRYSDGLIAMDFEPWMYERQAPIGVELVSDKIGYLLQSKRFSFQMNIYCELPVEENSYDNRTIVQIGNGDVFKFQVSNWNRQEFNIVGSAYKFDLPMTSKLKFNKWYTLQFDVFDDTFHYKVLDLVANSPVYSVQMKNEFESVDSSFSAVKLGNSDIYDAVHQFNGSICHLVFTSGDMEYVLSEKNVMDVNRIFDYANELKSELITQEDYQLTAHAFFESFNPADNSVYFIPAEDSRWVVQGNVLKNDEYSSLSKFGDTMMYDAWIDRGSWVTIQNYAHTPNNDERFSNVIRLYIEEELTNTENIEFKDVRIADDGESLQLLNMVQPVEEMAIYSLDGKRISSVQHRSRISTRSLPNGVYVLNYETADTVQHSVKFAK